MSTYLRTLRIGEYADIIVDGAIHKGMPHQYFHGRTGKIEVIRPHFRNQQEIRGYSHTQESQTEKD